MPADWAAAGFKGKATELHPADPHLLYSLNGANKQKGTHSSIPAGVEADTSGNSGITSVGTAEEALRIAQETYELVRDFGALFMSVLVLCLVAGIAACVYTVLRAGQCVGFLTLGGANLLDRSARLRIAQLSEPSGSGKKST